MTSTADLASARRAYASAMLSSVGVSSPALEAAYAAVPREAFLGPPPWRLLTADGYKPEDDPAKLYADVLVGLVPERLLNNGQPSGHALWLAAAATQPGDHAVHVGAGTGYYTAILAELVGSQGRVTAIEFDAALAARAAQNLRPRPNVTVIHGDGTQPIFAPADVIYVNAGASGPAPAWLDGLKQGGRLVLPLTAVGGALRFPAGAVFRITRESDGYSVKWVSPTAFFPCEGGRDPQEVEALAAAFAKGGEKNVTQLVRGPVEGAWVSTPTWSLL
jgi:protein-L-isoaspartate(D-aspartate) O-methyltransferase